MALVDYSSDSDDDETACQKGAIKDTAPKGTSKLPPLPSKFHDLYATNARVSTRDDPSLHDGRKRSTPHIQGNWPSHLYIEWYPSPTESGKLSSLTSSIQAQVPGITSFLTSNLGAILPLHISLSRSIGLLTPEKDEFLETITKSITTSNVRPFNVKFMSLDWVPNFENTRWFLVIRLSKPAENELNKLLGLCNETVKKYGKPPLYERDASESPSSPPNKRVKLGNGSKQAKSSLEGGDRDPQIPAADEKFHISIAWTLTLPTHETREITKKIEENMREELLGVVIGVREVKAKIGNVVSSLALPEKVKMERSLFG